MNAPSATRRLLGILAVLVTFAVAAAACGSDDSNAATDPEAPSSADGDADGDEDGDDDPGDHSGDDDEGSHDGDADDDGSENEDAMEEDTAGFPVNVETSSGTITLDQQPTSIVSLSPTATEMLFAIGAGEQVVAVDLNSNYPEEAPEPSLDGFTPDLEAILATEPDLVVATGLPEDITAGLAAAGTTVLFNPAAESFDDIYDQVAQLGEATGNIDGAAAVNAEIRQGVTDALAALPESDGAVRVFHEIDDSFYTATSGTFIGQVYNEMGFENIADPFEDGFGFPLVDGESIIAADPTLIIFTDDVAYTVDDIVARPGWDQTTAVKTGNVIQVDADISSRWGPRVVEFMQAIANAVSANA